MIEGANSSGKWKCRKTKPLYLSLRKGTHFFTTHSHHAARRTPSTDVSIEVCGPDTTSLDRYRRVCACARARVSDVEARVKTSSISGWYSNSGKFFPHLSRQTAFCRNVNIISCRPRGTSGRPRRRNASRFPRARPKTRRITRTGSGRIPRRLIGAGACDVFSRLPPLLFVFLFFCPLPPRPFF